ncbi:HAD-IIIA family hydrolase [Dactylosporangium aurantiacum]|uniref:D,D-heptose 1,7-bisphosphate phosphatase n=1 Tax=Dactylosporangium aurantiacum TaxID=35754 RepID=A0A9Q9MN74_9ACTN|nr:HAD-IIIA family hydrolase [Dactylosporangium aurantiacum]MDG6103803.1 HAD-IIIA family hydrolase [Dactylosporangium aurantiacum]UWZ58991.1 HAD-IIIA family hydrolase [Dactylosporangium aurantiacum]
MTVLAPRPAATVPDRAGTGLFDAVLFDRDGTLVHDVPYNGDPALVRPVDGAREALDRLRAAGLRLGVVTNQSGLARGRFTAEDLAAVHARIEQLLGPFDTWQVCPHDEQAGCRCRKPAPGMVLDAAAALGTTADRCVLIGDIGRDICAAEAAGATAVLVPTAETLLTEVASAPSVADTLSGAVDLVLHRQRYLLPADAATATAAPRTRRCVLVVRADSAGDVLVTGPAIRAVAAGAERVVMLCGPRGRSAAELLPGVDELLQWRLPWIDPRPDPVERAAVDAMVERIAATGAEEAVIFTSFHQSPLPTALLLRMAGIGRISAISDDYPGALLDVRHRVPTGVPEAERALSLAVAAGFAPPAGDDLRLRITAPRPERRGTYVVVHPGASVPARACPPEVYARAVAGLAAAGHRVLVTGGPDETALTAAVAAAGGTDLGGRTSMRELATLIAGAGCLVVGNTGPAHLAAAVGTPVVSLYAPTVPFGQWAPFRVPLVRLGDAAAPCRDSRAAVCPVPGHPCLSSVEPRAVLDAVRTLVEETS